MTTDMTAAKFIAGKLRFQGRVAVYATAISFFVVIVSLSVAEGFRSEIRDGLAANVGDICVTGLNCNNFSEADSISAHPSYLPEIKAVPGVRDIRPVIFRSGIVKGNGDLYGVVMKGVPDSARKPLTADIPPKLANALRLGEGDVFTAYFIGEKVKARRFTVAKILDAGLEVGENAVLITSSDDLRRVNGWSEDKTGAFEITLSPSFRNRRTMENTALEISAIAASGASDDDDTLVAVASSEKYGQLFDWLDLIDFNVNVILILMIIVAGFNMISGLLIMLFRNVSTIGMLKAMGMNDRGIALTFLGISARAVFKGMLVGNVLAVVLCLIQAGTHLLTLDPANYFVSFVPVSLNPLLIVMVDLIAFSAILCLLLIPSLFIAKVDPAESIRVE